MYCHVDFRIWGCKLAQITIKSYIYILDQTILQKLLGVFFEHLEWKNSIFETGEADEWNIMDKLFLHTNSARKKKFT